ncbi:MAG: hypothetical protein QOJ99_3664 [Bryobacterales bacterium]|jgi:tRNA(Ile2) C34 agmatinyltransferase TiaS|nr:hypothetical protein [Bryobacterales bacterium]
MIRHNTGMERILSFLTGLREYRCRDCDQKFRAPDRRLTPRESNMGSLVAKHSVSNAMGAKNMLHM